MVAIKNKYVAYKLTTTTGTATAKDIIFFDTETKKELIKGGELHTLRLGWAFYARHDKSNEYSRTEWFCIKNCVEFAKWIEIHAYNESTLLLMSHNMFFDLQVINFYDIFAKWGWKLDFIYDKGLTYILCITKGKKKIKCLSTTNFFASSLKELGKAVGLKKLDAEFDTITETDLSVYCKRDVEIIIEAMKKYWGFLLEHDMGNFTMTRASQALMSYRHRFMPQPIPLEKDDNVKEFERNAYYGGRCEAFELGQIQGGPFISLDINSMYPSVMKENYYPLDMTHVEIQPPLDLVRKYLISYCVTACVNINTDEPVYPIRQEGKIIFPVGKFQTYLTTPSIEYALDHGHIDNIPKILVYRRAKLFETWVNTLYPLRVKYKKEGNRPYELMIKILLNSLYGKFGQKKDDLLFEEYEGEETFIRIDNYEQGTDRKWTETILFNTKIINLGNSESEKSCVAIAAHVTDYARMYLWSIMKEIGLSRILYVDTDSVKIRKKHLRYVKTKVDEWELGALKNEGESKDFTIYGLKDYVWDGKRKAKGVPENAKDLGGGKFEYLSFLKSANHLRKRIIGAYMLQWVEKTLEREYTKGVIDEKGRIHPIHFG